MMWLLVPETQTVLETLVMEMILVERIPIERILHTQSDIGVEIRQCLGY
jgi:hypothetical protein